MFDISYFLSYYYFKGKSHHANRAEMSDLLF